MCFRNGLAKDFLPIFQHSSPSKRATRIGFMPLDILANVFIIVLFIVKFRVCEHNMPVIVRDKYIAIAELSNSISNPSAF